MSIVEAVIFRKRYGFLFRREQLLCFPTLGVRLWFLSVLLQKLT